MLRMNEYNLWYTIPILSHIKYLDKFRHTINVNTTIIMDKQNNQYDLSLLDLLHTSWGTCV